MRLHLNVEPHFDDMPICLIDVLIAVCIVAHALVEGMDYTFDGFRKI